MTENPNASRWATLTTKYCAFLSRNHEAVTRSGFLATHLRAAVVAGCGCDDSNVLFYKYELGAAPLHDRYEKVDSGHLSIVPSEHGWSFGLGVVLEPGPGGSPRTAVVIPFTIEIGDNEALIVQSHGFNDRVEVTTDTYERDLQEIAELTYQSLIRAVDSAATGGTPVGRIGFVLT